MDRIITFPETTLPLFLWKLIVNWRSRRGRSRHVYTPSSANRRGGSLKQDDCNPTTAFRSIIRASELSRAPALYGRINSNVDATRCEAGRGWLRGCSNADVAAAFCMVLTLPSFVIFFLSETVRTIRIYAPHDIQTQTNYFLLWKTLYLKITSDNIVSRYK